MEIYENSESVHKLNTFWEQSKIEISNIKTDQITFKSQDLPLARIKKIMKLDEDVKSMMISAEAPILFAKAAEFFIREITLRAWIHTERNKRRTLQRSDITLAVADGDTDQFDFLIDIVPRDEIKTHGSAKREEVSNNQPMHQVSGNLNIFGGNTIHLSTQSMSSNQQTLISGLVDSNNMLQAQANQNNINVQNQQQVQYVLQLPNGTSLGGGQTIQIQMIPQQTMLSNSGGDNTVNTMTTSGTVLNGQQQQQQQQIFTLSTGQGSHHHHGTTTMVLQPTMLTSGGGGGGGGQTQQLYSTVATTASAGAPAVVSSMDQAQSLQQQQQQHQVNVSNIVKQPTIVSTSGQAVATTTCVPTTDGGQYVMSSIKQDMTDPMDPGHQDDM